MSRFLGNVIADSLQHGVRYAERLQVGIAPEQFARFARPGGELVASNHAAFVYGHLALYGARIVTQLGDGSAGLAVPEQYNVLFSKDAVCQDDPEGSIYPPMAEVTRAFFTDYRAAIDVLRSTGDDVLQKPNPTGGRLTELFPTVGSMHAFYAGGHFMMHLGQLSAWRRMMGLPAA